MARERELNEPDQPYDLFFPDTVKDLVGKSQEEGQDAVRTAQEAIQEAP
jgi:hypothetical protein